MPNLGTYFNAACQGHIGNHLPGGWAAFPANTPVVAKDVASPVTKTIGNRIEIQAPQNWLNGNADEVRDTLLFEGINVIHKQRLDTLQANFLTNNQTLNDYGRAYADIEAETAWLTGLILNDMANDQPPIVLSGWGTNMRNAVGNFPNLPGFQAHFAATPQDAGANDQRQMTSETLYQFEWVSRSKATNIFKKIKDTWLAAEMANLSDKGTSTSDSPRVKMAKSISDLTDATTRFNAGSKGRVQSYNSALQQLANDHRINAGFLNTAPYICPSY